MPDHKQSTNNTKVLVRVEKWTISINHNLSSFHPRNDGCLKTESLKKGKKE